MERVWVAADNIVSPLGETTRENFSNLQSGKSGLKALEINQGTVHAGYFPNRENFNAEDNFGIFESLIIRSIEEAIAQTNLDPQDSKTVFIISSTKGEIDSLSHKNFAQEVNLYHSSDKVVEYFKNPNPPVVISNACISGSLAILVAKRLINGGLFDTAIVCGCDLISDFVISGFSSLQAISAAPCRPFDAARDGINMGEAAATMIITREPAPTSIVISGGATSNDANHISGPSRTGEELGIAIKKALEEAGIAGNELDFISAHGTATLFNDEMEANALNLLKLNEIPVNSLKGYYGHTLGAAGLVESIISVQSLLKNELIPTLGFENPGVSKSINVIGEKITKPLKNFLKTASGFGGCNAALIFEKI